MSDVTPDSARLPSGTVTFLFTDIEGSTRLARQFPDALPALLARHHALLRQAIAAHDGVVFQIIGDAFCAAFHSAADGLAAAIDAQRCLHNEPWDPAPIRVRMGMHTGVAHAVALDPVSGGYSGYSTLARTQRIMSCAHGGQILLSNATAGLVQEELAPGVMLRDLKEHRLKGLLNPERLWQVDAPDLPQDFPPLQTLDALPNNLPLQTTSFVGREREIDEVKRLLLTTRLLTLTGSGGAGKTRLSLQVAAEVLDGFKDGVWLVELAPLADPALVPTAVADVLGVREAQGRPLLETLLAYLQSKQLLLILDNCEHLLDACARFADRALHAGRGVRILASSREPLGIAGELAWRVPSLPTPGPEMSLPIEQLEGYAAVRLFVERAALARPGFALKPANAAAVAQICDRLDGIPLAIELAAARLRALSVEQLAVRLDDRFRLLTGGSRTAMPRHQTLRAAIDWSFDLLGEPERILMRRLAVFAGGFTLEAAEQVGAGEELEEGQVLDLLAHLVDKSLVMLDDPELATRYRMLETVRQYVRDKLLESGEGQAVRDRHLQYFLTFAEEGDRQIKSAGRLVWSKRLEAEQDNLRAALEWSLHGAAEQGLRLAAALARFWLTRYSFSEGCQWLEQLLAHSENASPWVRGRALAAAGILAAWNSDYEAGRARLEASRALFEAEGDKQGLAYALQGLAILSVWLREPAAPAYFQRALALYRETDDRWDLGECLSWSAWELALRGDYETAAKQAEESRVVLRGTGDRWNEAFPTLVLGQILYRRGDYGRAREVIARCLELWGQVGDTNGAAIAAGVLGDIARAAGAFAEAEAYYRQVLALTPPDAETDRAVADLGLGFVALGRGDAAAARAIFERTLEIWEKTNNELGMAGTFCGLAGVALAEGKLEQAVRLLAASAAFAEASGRPMLPSDRLVYDAVIQAARRELDAEVFEWAWREGSSWPGGGK